MRNGGLIPSGPYLEPRLKTIARCWACGNDYPIEMTYEHLATFFSSGRICKGCSKKMMDDVIEFLNKKKSEAES